MSFQLTKVHKGGRGLATKKFFQIGFTLKLFQKIKTKLGRARLLYWLKSFLGRKLDKYIYLNKQSVVNVIYIK